MEFAEKFAVPFEGELGTSNPRCNEFGEIFRLRWGRVRFEVFWGVEINLKVVLSVYHADGTREQFVCDTDPYESQWNCHKRMTRDFFLVSYPMKLGRVTCIKFAYIVHFRGSSIPSQYEYILMDGQFFEQDQAQRRAITREWATLNLYRTKELDAGLLQRDIDWYDGHFESLRLIPKFTKGSPRHPYHPKPYIHFQIDELIRRKRERPHIPQKIKVCVDCIDDTDFVNHLIYASQQGVEVKCIVDWRKMTMTGSQNYARLKRTPIELLGVFCMPSDSSVEVATDMHNKFIIFGEEDSILGSFNITFDRWGSNWESGMTFHSRGVCRLLDNIFQSIRGGVIQPYRIDPFSPFNLLYTFGRHVLSNGKYYRPAHAIISEIHRARHSIRLCLFLVNEMMGEYHDSVIEALIHARKRGVEIHMILNGHVAHPGDPRREYTMKEELNRPVLPAISRLRDAGIRVGLAYGRHDDRIPYCPLHSKYCIIDDYIVLEGSFNWYNTSSHSHDLLVLAANAGVAQPYIYEFHQIQYMFRIYY